MSRPRGPLITFPRPHLAGDVVRSLLSPTGFGDARNGLFLAAPRRTGKTTFLKSDLAPALEIAGVTVIYVDLWADTRRDPGLLVAEAIGRQLMENVGVVGRLARASGLATVTIAGTLTIDTTKIGQVEGATLPDALRALHDATGKPVALIIDEAQHALTSEAGEATMAALKSARDQLNTPARANLLLVMSGSDRDKLLRLVNSNAAPFYGSQLTRLPLLGEEFLWFVAHRVSTQRPDLAPVDLASLGEAFADFGHRPQFFFAALGESLSPLSDHPGRFEEAVRSAARQRQADEAAQMAADYLALRPLEQAVLWRMLTQGPRFRPYDADALRFYREHTGTSVTVARAQGALEGLRSRTPAMVWKSARGEYAVEDAVMLRWYEERVRARTWPPRWEGEGGG